MKYSTKVTYFNQVFSTSLIFFISFYAWATSPIEKELLKNGYVKIELTKSVTGHLILKGSVNGVEGNFILDTGASVTVIEQKLQEKYKLKTGDSVKSVTVVGGDLNVKYSYGNAVMFGRSEVVDYKITLLSIDHINNAFIRNGVKKVDGVLGSDILEAKGAIIDYQNFILYLKG